MTQRYEESEGYSHKFTDKELDEFVEVYSTEMWNWFQPILKAHRGVYLNKYIFNAGKFYEQSNITIVVMRSTYKIDIVGIFGQRKFRQDIEKPLYDAYFERISPRDTRRNAKVEQWLKTIMPDEVYNIQRLSYDQPLQTHIELEEFIDMFLRRFDPGVDHSYDVGVNRKLLGFGSNTIEDWYIIYRTDFAIERDNIVRKYRTDERTRYSRDVIKANPLHETQSIDNQNVIDDLIVEYPFTSKFKQFQKVFPKSSQAVTLESKVPDRRLMKEYLSKPYYSPTPGGWEIDHVFNLIYNGDIYLFAININTRYLVIFKCKEKAEEVQQCLEQLCKMFPNNVHSIRGDGSVAYSNVSKPSAEQYVSANTIVSKKQPTLKLLQWYSLNNIKFFFNNSPYTNHNRVIDSAIRTIRNAIGKRKLSEKQLQQIVWYYNHTPHRGLKFIKGRNITPVDMMNDSDLEWQYIRYCDMLLLKTKIRQKQYGLDSLTQGNVVIVHLEQAKTDSKFVKKRRVFDHLGFFEEYFNGNAVVRIIHRPEWSFAPDDEKIVYKNKSGIEYVKQGYLTVPLYCVRWVATNIDSIPKNIANVYLSPIPKEQ